MKSTRKKTSRSVQGLRRWVDARVVNGDELKVVVLERITEKILKHSQELFGKALIPSETWSKRSPGQIVSRIRCWIFSEL
uniref:Uncharacterized protein n=1 Tax=Tanacetum cinerariifolium TaxID=118510 RepID=A0A6L2P5D5_TANCI|nr:hypothetical protein [Tanacetum cinerariifolium]